MSKIRVLSDHLANQIAAGEVVERPASVAKELVENSIDAGARRIQVDTEAGGRRLLRVTDDGEGMSRDDAVLAFERHATSKISRPEDLLAIQTLGFRGEALASIAAVARVELITKRAEDAEATRVVIEGGRMRDVAPAAHPRGTTIAARDLFFNVPARRKFLRSEATENFHLTNLITHYALAHPEIAFTFTINGRETLRCAPAADLRERAYQVFGGEFLENLLEIGGGQERIALARGFVSAPRERRTSRDAQYLFVNGRYVRDRLISRALAEGYRTVLPPGVYPAALLFLEVPLVEVDVNVHPAKTEVRFRRAAAVADVVREAVRAALSGAGYLRGAGGVEEKSAANPTVSESEFIREARRVLAGSAGPDAQSSGAPGGEVGTARDIAKLDTPQESAPAAPPLMSEDELRRNAARSAPQQDRIEFGFAAPPERAGEHRALRAKNTDSSESMPDSASETMAHSKLISEANAPLASTSALAEGAHDLAQTVAPALSEQGTPETGFSSQADERAEVALPPVVSVAGFAREVTAESLTPGIRPLGQLADNYIVATDGAGLLLIDQRGAHERILFDQYRARVGAGAGEAQHLLLPETVDLTPAQAVACDALAAELESYGFELMRLSGRTVAIKAVPADLPPGEARDLLGEVLNTIDAGRHRAAREQLRDRIAAALARRAAIKSGTLLAPEKIRWLIERLLATSSPTTCPHGRPIILRLALRDIEKGFHRT